LPAGAVAPEARAGKGEAYGFDRLSRITQRQVRGPQPLSAAEARTSRLIVRASIVPPLAAGCGNEQ